MKEYKGLYDSLYKKWELYLIRLFQIAKYLENHIKFPKISSPVIKEILDEKGYNGYIRIPPNPFYLKDSDAEVFDMFFGEFDIQKEDDKSMKKLFIDVWERIGIIKRFLGITRNTRYMGEPEADKRLVNEIDVYIKYPESCSPIHALILGKHPTDKSESVDFIYLMTQLQNFLLDRDPVNKGDVKSYDQY